MARTYLRCKACGFIIEEGKLKDVCPACGVKRTMFIPDPEKLNEKRRLILDSHIHPIIVHAPQGFAFFLLMIGIVALFARGGFHDATITVVRYLAICLPLFTIGAFISGLFDAKVRFRKFSTPILRIKIRLGVIFLATTLLAAALAALTPLDTLPLQMGINALFLVGFLCTAVLGKLGASILGSKFSG